MFGIPVTVAWGILFGVFAFLEIITAGTLVSIWFCIGSLLAMIAAYFGASEAIQVIIFFVVSIVLLILTKPIARKLIPKDETTNVSVIIGMYGVVTEKINNIEAEGAVKVAGKEWTARSQSEDVVIDIGSKVEILEIQGVKVIVKAIDD